MHDVCVIRILVFLHGFHVGCLVRHCQPMKAYMMTRPSPVKTTSKLCKPTMINDRCIYVDKTSSSTLGGVLCILLYVLAEWLKKVYSPKSC